MRPVRPVGARAQLAALSAGTVTSVELVDHAIADIERTSQLNAFRVVLADEARRDAVRADELRASGAELPLLGLPIAVKDDTDVAGVETLLGSGSTLGTASDDAPLVAALRAAGAVVVGKTHLPELALWGVTSSQWHGTSRNPWDPSRTPGGSSGGAAAAVAAGLVPLATGSDGLGSLRIPAAACGVVALKPSRGLIPQRNPGWHGMSEVGLIARDVADLSLGLQVVAELPTTAVPTSLRIGWSTRPPLPGRVDREVKAAVAAAVAALASTGHSAKAVTVPYGVSSVPAALIRTWFAGAADDQARLADPSRVERRTARLTRLGKRTKRFLPWTHRNGERLAARLDAVLASVDVLVLPATATLPPKATSIDGKGLIRTMLVNAQWAPFTGVFNASGHPALSLPARWTAAGMPVGVQLVGRKGSDALLLGLAAQLEAALALPTELPPLG